MSEVLDRLLAVFVEPAPRAAVVPAVSVAMPTVAVLCAPGQEGCIGGAVALELASRAGSVTATLCVWGAPASQARLPSAPVGRGARRVAAALARHGLDAAGSGRLARVVLDPDPAMASAGAIRAEGASPGPVVVAIGGPRDRSWDPVLAAVDRTLVVTRPDSGNALAAAACAGLDGPCASAVIAARPLARLAAATGLGVTPSLRRAVAPLLEALG